MTSPCLSTLLTPGGDGSETFHANVVLAGASLVYIGSANLLAQARHSMGLSVVVDGKEAHVVASALRAVSAAAAPFALGGSYVSLRSK